VTWLVVVLGLALLIFLHELGHFTAARLLGMKPRAFYIGFPPAIAKVKKNGTEYGIGAIPLGGYVRIPGMQKPSSSDFQTLMSSAVAEDPALASVTDPVQDALGRDDFDAVHAAVPALKDGVGQASLTSSARRSAEQAVQNVDEGSGSDAYWRQPTRKRVAVIAAGPGMNILVAFLLFFAVNATGAPSQTPSTEVAAVAKNTPAAAAGLRAGDRIVAVDGQRTRTFDQASKRIHGSHGRPITVTVERGGREVTLGPRRAVRRRGTWVWGFTPAPTLVSHPVGASARIAAQDCWRVVTGTVASIGALFHGGHDSQVTGPVGIVRTSAQALQIGPPYYLELLGLISMSLALFNLLPLLPLDGGNILVALIEGLRRRSMPQVVYQRFSAVGMALILLVTLIALSNDISGPPQ
jgi:regulator of sigma E protease